MLLIVISTQLKVKTETHTQTGFSLLLSLSTTRACQYKAVNDVYTVLHLGKKLDGTCNGTYFNSALLRRQGCPVCLFSSLSKCCCSCGEETLSNWGETHRFCVQKKSNKTVKEKGERFFFVPCTDRAIVNRH